MIYSDMPDAVIMIFGFSLMNILSSVFEIAKHRSMQKAERKKHIGFFMKREIKYYYLIKYFIFAIKAITLFVIAVGFYQWFDNIYAYKVLTVLHTSLVAAVLSYNLYVDTFEGKWYGKINITILKDDFVQRKLITMLFLAVFVSANAFIVLI